MPYDVDIGDGADALGQNQLTDALDGTYWVSGWDATLGTGDLEVDIAAGSGAVGGTDVSTGSTQTIDFTGDPDSTDPRKAVIYVDSGGTVQKALGTPQPVDPSGEIRFRTYNPSPPASVSGVVVAEVWLAAGETVLASDDVRDRRVSNDAVESSAPALGWVEDGNSPLIIDNTDQSTYTLDGEYDEVQVRVYTTNADPNDLLIRFNNDSGNNYNIFQVDGVETTGNSSIPTEGLTRPNRRVFTVDGRWSEICFAHFQTYTLTGDAPSGARNDNIISPLTDITFIGDFSESFSATVEVYGRNYE